MEPEPPPDPEDLLARTAWVRALARRLVDDPHVAEERTSCRQKARAIKLRLMAVVSGVSKFDRRPRRSSTTAATSGTGNLLGLIRTLKERTLEIVRSRGSPSDESKHVDWQEERRMRMKSWVGGLLALVLLSGQARADMLDNAKNYLNAVGIGIPSGYTVRWGTDTEGGAAGEVKPNNPEDLSEGGEIVINPEGIKKLAPRLTGDVKQFGGVIVVVLYHEIKHADGSYGPGCGEIAAQKHVAEKCCEFICFILIEIPDADVSPLCTFYSDVQNRFNNGVAVPGGASTSWARLGCSGPYPGDIPDCGCCGSGGGN